MIVRIIVLIVLSTATRALLGLLYNPRKCLTTAYIDPVELPSVQSRHEIRGGDGFLAVKIWALGCQDMGTCCELMGGVESTPTGRDYARRRMTITFA